MLCTHYASYKTNDPEYWFWKTRNGCIALQCLTIKNPKFGIPYDIGIEGHTIYNKDFSKISISMIDATLDSNQCWYVFSHTNTNVVPIVIIRFLDTYLCRFTDEQIMELFSGYRLIKPRTANFPVKI